MYDQDDMYGEFRQRNPMASASIALGIASLLSCPTFYIAFPCGALAIICAILSRGKFRLSGKGKAGIICGIIGMILSAVITVTAVRTVLTNPLMKARLEQTLQLYLGDSSFDLDEALNNLLPALNSSGNDSTPPAAGEAETEEESEKRVRLRIAEDVNEPETALEHATENPAADQAADKKAQESSTQTETETESETAQSESNGRIGTTEPGNNTQNPEEKMPITIPEGGGSFI